MKGHRQLLVFISYASEDRRHALRISRLLERAGIECWLDVTKLRAGDEWRLRIRNAITQSDAVLILLSNSSTSKEGFVQAEIRIALECYEEKPEGTLFILPVRLDPCRVPTLLQRLQWIDLFPSTRQATDRLLDALAERARQRGVCGPKPIPPREWNRLRRLMSSLSDSNFAVRLAAIRSLAGSKTQSIVVTNALSGAAADQDQQVRLEAIQALAFVGVPSQKAADNLIKTCGDKFYPQALAALARVAPNFGFLSPVLPRLAVKPEFCWAVREVVKVFPSEAVGLLLPLLEDAQLEVKVALCRVLGASQNTALPALSMLFGIVNSIKQAEEPKGHFVGALLDPIAEIGGATALHRLLGHANIAVRRELAASTLRLSADEEEGAIQILERLLWDPEWQVHRRAAEVLSEWSDKTARAVSVLLQALTRDNPWSRAPVPLALASIGVSVLPQLTKIAADEVLDQDIREGAIISIGLMGSRALPALDLLETLSKQEFAAPAAIWAAGRIAVNAEKNTAAIRVVRSSFGRHDPRDDVPQVSREVADKTRRRVLQLIARTQDSGGLSKELMNTLVEVHNSVLVNKYAAFRLHLAPFKPRNN